jgi:hypothetical protein
VSRRPVSRPQAGGEGRLFCRGAGRPLARGRGKGARRGAWLSLSAGRPLVPFVKEDFRIFTPPSRAAFPIFTDDDSKPHAGATVAVLTALTQFQHAIAQFVAYYPSPRWRCWGNRDRGCSRRRAILRRNHDPSTIGPRLVTTLLVITVAARPWLALRSDGSASGPADDRADRSPAPAAHCSA